MTTATYRYCLANGVNAEPAGNYRDHATAVFADLAIRLDPDAFPGVAAALAEIARSNAFADAFCDAMLYDRDNHRDCMDNADHAGDGTPNERLAFRRAVDMIDAAADRAERIAANLAKRVDHTTTVPCRRCGDTDRFDDHGDSVCSTCGATRRKVASHDR